MILQAARTPLAAGGKPRASGDDPPYSYYQPGRPTVNPARAGMILTLYAPDDDAQSKPRASGDDPASGGLSQETRP